MAMAMEAPPRARPRGPEARRPSATVAVCGPLGQTLIRAASVGVCTPAAEATAAVLDGAVHDKAVAAARRHAAEARRLFALRKAWSTPVPCLLPEAPAADPLPLLAAPAPQARPPSPRGDAPRRDAVSAGIAAALAARGLCTVAGRPGSSEEAKKRREEFLAYINSSASRLRPSADSAESAAEDDFEEPGDLEEGAFCSSLWVEPAARVRHGKAKVAKRLAGLGRRTTANPLQLRAPIPRSSVLNAVRLAADRAKASFEGAQDFNQQGGPRQAQKLKVKVTEADEEQERKWSFDGIEDVRRAMLNAHGKSIKHELGVTRLLPTTLSQEVADRFVRRCQCSATLPDFGYHGTKRRNFENIFQDGLQVPRQGGIGVANGSAYGVGIYSANPGNFQLSRSYCDSSEMLVCGILTRPRPSRAKYNDGHTIKCHRGFRVIFDEQLVAPLWIADLDEVRDYRSRLDTPGNQNRVGSERAGAGQILIKGSGETVFEPPEPHICNHCLRVQRHRVRGIRHSRLRLARDFKATLQ